MRKAHELGGIPEGNSEAIVFVQREIEAKEAKAVLRLESKESASQTIDRFAGEKPSPKLPCLNKPAHFCGDRFGSPLAKSVLAWLPPKSRNHSSNTLHKQRAKRVAETAPKQIPSMDLVVFVSLTILILRPGSAFQTIDRFAGEKPATRKTKLKQISSMDLDFALTILILHGRVSAFQTIDRFTGEKPVTRKTVLKQSRQ